MQKARESLQSAQSESAAGRGSFAVNRLYYACFYAACAVLAARGQEYSKHSAVRAAFHRDIVNAGLVDPAFGELYDGLFEERSQGDYVAFVSFEPETVETLVRRVDELLQVVCRHIP
jgi:hypothetical protein